MKKSKLLSKIFLPILLTIVLFSNINSLHAEEEAVDIWNIEEKKEIEESDNEINSENLQPELNLKIDFGKIDTTNLEVIKDEDVNANINLAGIYDPSDYGLSIDMWSNSNGEDLIKILKRLEKIEFSKDTNELIKISLLTNSYIPSKNISEAEFINFKLNYLLKNNNLDLIKSYLIKNPNSPNNSKLIKYYVESYLSDSDLENACKIFDDVNIIDDDYLIKFKIYCLINRGNREEAQLLFDLVKESNFNDVFFENKFNILMGYSEVSKDEISEKNILEFHLSHRTILDFKYKPTKKTSQIIWKYLSSSNLFENINEIDLENHDEILLIEQAVHEGNYKENDLLELYKRFKFNINQLINVQESYKLLPPSEGRALIYQRLLLSNDTNQILNLSSKLKNSFEEQNLNNAFTIELKNILQKIDKEQVPSNYTSFYMVNLKNEKDLNKKIKINNKVIHQSKLLNYFKEDYELAKIEKDTNDIIKKIKKNKNYFVSIKDLMILESLTSDGVKILKKYENLFEFNQSDIPTDIQLLINNNEVGFVLLRIAEIIGEDELNDLGPETIYFIISTLNQLNIDPLRNNILLKVLPLKV
tara:strand:+ start:8939 stop:10702 length:1764 start_codon:yes stop_codon:yes gene_type:complete